MNITRNPLCWPENVARTAPQLRTHAQFAEKSRRFASALLLAEINRLNGRAWDFVDESVIISSNVPFRRDGKFYSEVSEPPDPGVAVYFQLRIWRASKWFARHIVLTCDKWNKVAWNLYSIAKDIEAQRARSRWGCTNVEQAFRGYLAIPAKCGGFNWWDFLEVSPQASEGEIKAAYRCKAATRHPDVGGDPKEWDRLQLAYEQAMNQIQR